MAVSINCRSWKDFREFSHSWNKCKVELDEVLCNALMYRLTETQQRNYVTPGGGNTTILLLGSSFNFQFFRIFDSFYEICCGPHLFDLHQSSSLHWPWVSDSIFDEISTTRLCLKLVVLHWVNTSAVCRLEWNCLLKFCPRSFPACTLMEARLQCWWGHTTCYYFPISTFENAT